MSKTQELILQNGGNVLNEAFIRHRTLPDVLAAIQRSTPDELMQIDESGAGLLHFAAKMKDGIPIVKLLLKNGLSPSLKDFAGNKPVNFARTDDMVILLLRSYSS